MIGGKKLFQEKLFGKLRILYLTLFFGCAIIKSIKTFFRYFFRILVNQRLSSDEIPPEVRKSVI